MKKSSLIFLEFLIIAILLVVHFDLSETQSIGQCSNPTVTTTVTTVTVLSCPSSTSSTTTREESKTTSLKTPTFTRPIVQSTTPTINPPTTTAAVNYNGHFQTLTGHTKQVVKVYELSNGLLVSSSDDFTIKIWNLTTNSCVNTIDLSGRGEFNFNLLVPLQDGNFAISMRTRSNGAGIFIFDSISGLEIRNITHDTWQVSDYYSESPSNWSSSYISGIIN
jgi:WD40 repeat protein